MAGPEKGREFSSLAPAGYYIALHVGFAFPMAEHNALPEAWIEHYTQQGLMVHDPVMRWLYAHSGACRWSAMGLPDPRGVMALAEGHGLRFGVAIACAPSSAAGQRSFASFAREDREFTEDEIAVLAAKLQRLHEATAPPTNLTRAELEALRMVRDGMLLKEIAARLGVSEGAVKQRLRNAKAKLGAKTGSQAVSVAVRYGLI